MKIIIKLDLLNTFFILPGIKIKEEEPGRRITPDKRNYAEKIRKDFLLFHNIKTSS